MYIQNTLFCVIDKNEVDRCAKTLHEVNEKSYKLTKAF